MRSLGVPELAIILIIAIFLFGGKKLPEIAKGLGEGIKNFKNSMKNDDKPEDSDTKKQPEEKRA